MIDYPVELYAETRATVKASAEALVPRLVERFKPETVLDVGCGEGWWAEQFADLACTVTALDGPHVEPVVDGFIACDLEEPFEHPGHDLAISLEVAEHLSPERADGFVADLCAAAPTVVFSAAIPGQGGAGHVNEQWPAYWVEKFAEHGYYGSGALRERIWTDPRIAPWYRQNLLVFGDLSGFREDRCLALVHPDIWGWYR